MDKYAPRLLDLGQRAMIGKGKRTSEVINAIIRNQSVYFAAIGGAGALLSKCIKKSELEYGLFLAMSIVLCKIFFILQKDFH